MEPRTFYYSKNTNTFWLFGYLLIVGISCWGLLNGDLEVSRRVVAFIILLLFSFMSFEAIKYRIKPAIKKVPILFMDEKGISFLNEHVLLSWDNLESVKMIATRSSGEVLYLNIKDPQAILSVTSQGISMGLAKGFSKKWLTITPLELAGEEDVYDIIRKFYSHYGPTPDAIMFHRPGRETWPSEGT